MSQILQQLHYLYFATVPSAVWNEFKPEKNGIYNGKKELWTEVNPEMVNSVQHPELSLAPAFNPDLILLAPPGFLCRALFPPPPFTKSSLS